MKPIFIFFYLVVNFSFSSEAAEIKSDLPPAYECHLTPPSRHLQMETIREEPVATKMPQAPSLLAETTPTYLDFLKPLVVNTIVKNAKNKFRKKHFTISLPWIKKFASLDEEFFSKSVVDVFPKKVTIALKNHEKNRYNNNGIPYDHLRVLLSNLDDDQNYFNGSPINANQLFLEDNLQLHRYIIGSAPIVREFYRYSTRTYVDDTTDDFWRVIWDEQIPLVINLTYFEQPDRDNPALMIFKSEQYWPDENKSRFHGKIKVSNKEMRKIDNFLVIVFELQAPTATGDESRIVYFIYYPDWPDSWEEPKLRTDLMKIIGAMELVMQKNKASNLLGPIFVHCSAGVRRSGMFVALAIAIQYIDATGNVPNLPLIIEHLQYMRFGLVGYQELCEAILWTIGDYYSM